MHAAPTANDFFLANFYPHGQFTCIFPKPLPSFSVLAVANIGSCVVLQNKPKLSVKYFTKKPIQDNTLFVS